MKKKLFIFEIKVKESYFYENCVDALSASRNNVNNSCLSLYNIRVHSLSKHV